MTSQTLPTWQLILIAWGEKYPVGEINRVIRSVREQASRPPRVILLTDRPRAGLEDGVESRDIPEHWLTEAFRRGGCQAKLCMFETGVLPDDLPALFLDLDTMVMGDVTRILDARRDEHSIAILQSAVLPFGALARALYRATNKRRYARGNSSVVAFHPAHCGFIASEFRRLEAIHGIHGYKPLAADERFISWSAQPVMQAVSKRHAVKFPTEFMLPWPWLARFFQALPWVAKRRAGLIAVTFPGVEVKFEELLALPEGARIVDRKGRILEWSRAALGPLKDKIIAYWT